uniref:Uncharacterized protein n=2 Tax=Kalanchoe fedtschenkoi TaxID=63787 RepID=A0A7N0ZR84_KALFE
MKQSEVGARRSMLNFMDRLRPLVGSKGWDYCAVWRLNQDQRFLELMGCCCAGADNEQDKLKFLVSPQLPCRDTVFQHQRTECCDHLCHLPSSVPLNSEFDLISSNLFDSSKIRFQILTRVLFFCSIYAEAFFSSQPRWLNVNLNTFSDPQALAKEVVGTQVLIPVLGGLVELFVAKQVAEDKNVVDFIAAQCAIPLELDALLTSSLQTRTNPAEENPQPGAERNHASPSNSYQFHQPVANNTNQQACKMSSPKGFSQQFNCDSAAENEPRNIDAMMMSGGSGSASDMPSQSKDGVRLEAGRSDSTSDCSDQIDDEDEAKCRRRNGKGQSKNLEAERRRRKKLNERLYKLRALVPIISKLDKASILVDAIDYVKQLKKQVEELRKELEQESDNKGDQTPADSVSEFVAPNTRNVAKPMGHEKVQQMEPQVEVTPVDGSKFFIRVFCEQKPGGFVRLLEALSSLGLEVTNVNVTSYRMLVSNVFQVEMTRDDIDDHHVAADDLRKSLLELTQIPVEAPWPDPLPDTTSNMPEYGVRADNHFPHHHALLNHHTSPYHFHHN